jgi:hypothetical protein
MSVISITWQPEGFKAMKTHRNPNGAARLCQLIASLHRLATGKELQPDEARIYFQDPHEVASVIEASGILKDPQRRREIERLLSEYERSTLHGDADGL